MMDVPKIKLCGLTRPEDIQTANQLKPDYIGFVFATSSRRYVTPALAYSLRQQLDPSIDAVGVFVQADPHFIADLLNQNIIQTAQLQGNETEEYLKQLRSLTDRPLFKAFSVSTQEDIFAAEQSSGDLVLLDSGKGGTGTSFPWELAKQLKRPFFLAGGLTCDTVQTAIATLHPYGVDVSSGIETLGRKDPEKMAAFMEAVRA